MTSTVTTHFLRGAALCATACFVLYASVDSLAAEYRLFVNDTAGCRSVGMSGSNCVVPAGTKTSTTQTTTSSSSSSDCVVTTWNPCANSSSSTSTSSSSSSSSSSSVTTAPSSSSTTTSVTSTTVSTGNGNQLDYGSGGGAVQKSTIEIKAGQTKALNFTTQAGKYFGGVTIVPTSGFSVNDGSSVRMWLSTSAGGAPLAGRACSKNVGVEGGVSWDQTGTRSYACQVPAPANLFLNLALCISDAGDTTCTAAGARYGSQTQPAYIRGSSSLSR
jgi:hypothetical protein